MDSFNEKEIISHLKGIEQELFIQNVIKIIELFSNAKTSMEIYDIISCLNGATVYFDDDEDVVFNKRMQYDDMIDWIKDQYSEAK